MGKGYESKTLTSLPQALREAVDLPVGAVGGRPFSGANASIRMSGKKVRASRKEKRQRGREEKKRKRANYHENHPDKVEKRAAAEKKKQERKAAQPARPSKRKRQQLKKLADSTAAPTDMPTPDQSANPLAKSAATQPGDKPIEKRQRRPTPSATGDRPSRPASSEEEKLVARLRGKNSGNASKLRQEFEEDGFGDLLDVLDMSDLFDEGGQGEDEDDGRGSGPDSGSVGEGAAKPALAQCQRQAPSTEDANLVARLRGKKKGHVAKLKQEFEEDGFGDLLDVLDMSELFNEDGQDIDGEEGHDATVTRGGGGAKVDLYGQHDDDEAEEGEEEGEDDDVYGDGNDADRSIPLNSKPSTATASASTYIPPHLRKKAVEPDAAAAAMARSVKAQLNRLTERNVVGAASAIHSLFLHNAHAIVHEALGAGILDLACAPGMGVSPLTTAYAATVLAVTSKVGVDVLGRFLERVVPRYIAHVKADESDEAANALIMIIDLFLLKGIHHDLLVDIAKHHCKTFKEIDVEMVLILLRRCGSKMRTEDPAALKQLFASITSHARQWSSDSDQDDKDNLKNLRQQEGGEGNAVRVRFMLEMITDLKNNRMRSENSSSVEHLRKELRGVAARRGGGAGGESVLRVHLDTLLSTKSRGRWWVVGDTRKRAAPTLSSMATVATVGGTSADLKKLEAAADRLRINTDTRRQVFMGIMTATDVDDALHRVLRLALKGEQQREIVRVIIHCCLNERTYNPYYAHVLQKVAEAHQSHRYTLQYTLWDKIKALRTDPITKEKQKERQLRNLAQLIGQVIEKRILPLTILRVLDMHTLEESERLLLAVVFAHVLSQPDDLVDDILAQVEQASGTEMVCDGMSFFLQKHFLTDEAIKANSTLFRKAYKARQLMERRSLAIG